MARVPGIFHVCERKATCVRSASRLQRTFRCALHVKRRSQHDLYLSVHVSRGHASETSPVLPRYPRCSCVLRRAELAQHAFTLPQSSMTNTGPGHFRPPHVQRVGFLWALCVRVRTGAVSRDRIETGSQGRAHEGGFGDHPRRRQRPSAALSHRLHASYCEAPLRRAWCTHACVTLAPQPM